MRILCLFILAFVLACDGFQLESSPTRDKSKPVDSQNIILPAFEVNNLDIIDPLVYNGTKSVDGEFPAMGWKGNCTATAVALDVVFTAAHCQSSGSSMTFQHRGSGKTYSGVCTNHPRYNTRTIYNDYSFCKLSEKLPADTLLASFDMVNPVKAGEKVLMNGFGQPNIRVHYWGSATVSRISGQDIVTCGPANLGSGDSGGSLLAWTEDRSGKTMFKIIGVNSRGGGGCSYFNMTTHSEFAWAKEYATSKGVEICGVNKDCSEDPVEPPTPEECSGMYAALSQCMVSDAAGSCKLTYDRFKLCLKFQN